MDNPIGAVSCHLRADCPRAAADRARELGLDAIEIFALPEAVRDSAAAEQIARAVERNSLACSYHAPWGGQWNLAAAGPDAVGVLGEFIDAAAARGAQLMTIHLGDCGDDADRQAVLKTLAGVLDATLPRAQRHGVVISIENVPALWGGGVIGGRAADFDFLFEAVRSPLVGLNLDVGHANLNGDIGLLLSRHGRRLINTHLHDNHGDNDDHFAPGKGTVDWDGLFDTLERLDYRGPLNFEFPDAGDAYRDFARTIRAHGQ